ncbi:multicopper oxidase family protein [Streptosporangium roseum]|uniref:multicopper oxidase family protein n=1 Tax=Streptosporangium roseum TaxID=2001 RepID=UPI0033277D47
MSAVVFVVVAPPALLIDRLGRRAAIRWAVAGGLALAAKGAVTVSLLANFGWLFAGDQVLVEIPVVLIPAAVAAFLASRGARPMLAVRVTAVGAFLGFFHAFTVKAETPNVFGYGVLLLLSTAVLRAWPPVRSRLGTTTRMVAVVALVAMGLGYGSFTSRWPERHTMAGMGHGHRHGAVPSVDAADLTGPRVGRPDRSFTLTAAETPITLASGAAVAAWTFNGQAPGPELRVQQGDLVQVTLINRLPEEGVTLHWHGLDVPNAEDGVAGLTQDAVRPGGTHIYRFRAEQTGTYWYHTHQASSTAVVRGLFGALVVEPAARPEDGLDLVVMSHVWPVGEELRPAFGTADTLTRRTVAPGTPVRLRLVNTGNNTASDAETTTFALTGTPYRVTAIDGVRLHNPADLTGVRLPLATGGRYDLTFTMPEGPVHLADLAHSGGGLLLPPTAGAHRRPSPRPVTSTPPPTAAPPRHRSPPPAASTGSSPSWPATAWASWTAPRTSSRPSTGGSTRTYRPSWSARATWSR